MRAVTQSKLERYRTILVDMKYHGKSFREIQEFLEKNKKEKVSLSTLHAWFSKNSKDKEFNQTEILLCRAMRNLKSK